MNGTEALNLLMNGKKIRKTYWHSHIYIYFDINGVIRDQNGREYSNSLGDMTDNDWEEYIQD